MTPEYQLEIYKKLDSRLTDLTVSKAHDYANVDVLSNFKSVSSAAKELGVDITTPTGYALFMVLLKIARLTNLIKSGKLPNNESLDDTFLDGINYFKLSYCCFLEETKDKTTPL